MSRRDEGNDYVYDDSILWLTIIVFALIWGFVAAIIADKKNRSGVGFFFAGLLLGVFGVLWAWAAGAGLPEEGPASPIRWDDDYR